MAHLLARLGEAALKPQKVNGVWRKAAISAKNVARLRKEALLEGREWPYEKPQKEWKPVKCKGQKHDRQKPQREKAIEDKLALADQRIAEYRAACKAPLQNATLLDKLLLSPKLIRFKARGGS